jgi:tripartite-type tricarboxylate transporter receptor subunit TctC
MVRSLAAKARAGKARRAALLMLAALSLAPDPCAAQHYPVRPVKIVVGYAPGGGNDVVARLLAKKFQEMTGQPFVVENKLGADSTIASHYVATAPADGYTLLGTGMGGITIAPVLYGRQLSYDPIKDFAAVGTVARFAYVLATNSSIPARTVDDLIAYARANPGKINYGDAAPPTRLATEIFAQKANLALNRIFYKGSAATSQALLTNEVQLVISDATALVAHQGSGKINILGVTTRKRINALPDIPALAESPALAGFDFDAWVGLFAPSRTPASVVSVLNELLVKAVSQPDFRDRLAPLAAEVVGDTPQQAADRVRADLIRNTEAARAANMIQDSSDGK